ncbi:hypothetical protein [uncultured Photobacterium sp.]|uniref:hypothetical protein n=1 Tax=uncultured Photobacterium sp. TaxID=173973 RepID=UPI00262F7443|nr:hypothetical protein [uncultured Photobacterium sp.]
MFHSGLLGYEAEHHTTFPVRVNQGRKKTARQGSCRAAIFALDFGVGGLAVADYNQA